MTVIGYVPGAYDMFHVGHLRILQRSAERCDVLIAGVVDGAAARAMKGSEPVVSLEERLEIVRAVACVHDAVVDHSESKLEAHRRVGFHALFKGDDWRGTEKGDRLERELETVGATVFYLPYTAETSSTLLRGRIEDYLPERSES